MAATSSRAQDRAGAALECAAVLAAMYVARLVAPSIGIARYAGPFAIVTAVVLATVLLARRGASWRSVGLARPPYIGRAALWAMGTLLVLSLILPAVLQIVATTLRLPPQDFSRFGDIRHDTTHFLVLLIPIGWGTAAFGEELVYRGFLNTRIASIFGSGAAATAIGVVGQAVLFGYAHAYLGPRGVMNAAAIGLVAGGVYLADGRNLWPLIVAHGLVDTVNLTLLHLGAVHQG